MRELLENDTLRRLTLIENLFAKQSWQTTKQLAHTLSCSESVLLKDIVLFNELFDAYSRSPDYQSFASGVPLKIETSQNGVRIVCPSALGLDAFYYYVLKNTPSFQLLELIFFETTLSIAELSQRLFVSVPTLYRLVDKINANLNTYELKLKLNPCRLEGNETEIRRFYYFYFLECYSSGFPWTFLDDEAVVDDLMLTIWSTLSLPIEVNDVHHAKIYTAVHLQRTRQQKFMSYSLHHYQPLVTHFMKHLPALCPFEEELKVRFSENTIAQVFTYFIDLFMPEEQLQKLQWLDDFLQTLAKKQQLVISNSRQVAQKLLSITRSSQFFITVPHFIIYDSKKVFNAAFAEKYTVFYESLTAELRAFLQHHKVNHPTAIFNELIYTILISWDSLLVQLQPKVKVLVLSLGRSSQAKIMADSINIRFNQRVSMTIYSKSFINHAILRTLDFDILITDTSFFLAPPQTVIWVNPYPNPTDWHLIKRTIQYYEDKRLHS